jgi:5-(carboxyamino)imidazole ribonucleotide mutase
MSSNKPQVGIIMGSQSDLDVMSEAAKMLDRFNVDYEVRIISAHRTPREMMEYADSAKERGLKVIIAGAGGSAHLPGMTASETTLPVIAVPVKRDHHDHEALWSNIKMPPGIPLATLPENGAGNAALLVVRVLALGDAELASQYEEFVNKQRAGVIDVDNRLIQKGWKEFK